MDKITPEELKKTILEQVEKYYQLTFAEEQEFQPGKSNLGYAGRIFDAQEMRNLTDATLEFWLTAGRYTHQFEQQLAEFLDLPFALLVNSGSSANLLAFMTLTSPLLGERRIKRGDEVITVAAAFPTTVAPIVQYGAVPVFVDVELETANINPDYLEEAWSPRCKAVMLAHTLGNPFDLRRVKDFCDRHQLWLIEDNCDALGSRYAGQYTGTWGDLATSSFYPPHHLTLGEGGAVYGKNPQLRKIAQSLRDWGRDCSCPPGVDNSCGRRFSGQYGSLPYGYDHKYVYSHFGYNLKATDLQAAIGCAQLPKLPDFGTRRRENHAFLKNRLSDLPGLHLQSAYPDSDPSWFGFLLSLGPETNLKRNQLTAHLEKLKIQTRNLFAGNLLRHPCCQNLQKGQDYRQCGNLPNTDFLLQNSFWIGTYPGLNREKLQFMADSIRAIWQEK